MSGVEPTNEIIEIEQALIGTPSTNEITISQKYLAELIKEIKTENKGKQKIEKRCISKQEIEQIINKIE
jgi:hypothetical protein